MAAVTAPVGTGRRVVRWTVLAVTGVYLLLPLLAMLEFSTRGAGGQRSLEAWRDIGSSSDLLESIVVSLQLAALTVLGMLVLLVPTMTWVHLRLPRLRRVVEFLCLLPLTIPAIVLVVGLAPIYAWVSYFLGNSPGTASLTGTGPDGEVLLLPRTRLQPDTRHRFVLDGAPAVDRVRLDVFPDGGMARLRLWGRPTAAGRAALGRSWFDALPDVQALEVLRSVGLPPEDAGRLVGARPVSGELPSAVARLLDGS